MNDQNAKANRPTPHSTTTASEYQQIRRKRLGFLVSSGSVMGLT